LQDQLAGFGHIGQRANSLLRLAGFLVDQLNLLSIDFQSLNQLHVDVILLDQLLKDGICVCLSKLFVS